MWLGLPGHAKSNAGSAILNLNIGSSIKYQVKIEMRYGLELSDLTVSPCIFGKKNTIRIWDLVLACPK